ncbi:helix-turn-helix transcriptional regulator [Naumannella sp. ID2617S]|nr:helix-turn-helix transcriptional regulator [Naumannella sp. ID2617S]
MSAHRLPEGWPDITRTLGVKVRTHREAQGLTQEQLAEAAGISRNQVQNIELNRNNQAGAGNPRLDTVYALARALRVDVGYLVDHRQPLDPPT